MADGDRIPKVLVVDDEPNIRELVEVALKFHGCAVSVSASGKDALHQAETYEPDLMILDVMLPDMDGFEVCRALRQDGNEVPVIFLTARDTTSDTIRGLTLGGDDYVTKPFSVEALVARVRAVLRRTTRTPGGDGAASESAMLQVGDLELDEEHWVVRRAGTQVELSPTEFRLLAYLMRARPTCPSGRRSRRRLRRPGWKRRARIRRRAPRARSSPGRSWCRRRGAWDAPVPVCG